MVRQMTPTILQAADTLTKTAKPLKKEVNDWHGTKHIKFVPIALIHLRAFSKTLTAYEAARREASRAARKDFVKRYMEKPPHD